MNIVLIGFRGTGKSTLGRALAEKVKRPFIDTDDEICKRSQMSIAEIFASVGKRGFRDIESKIVQEIDTQTDKIIACGGGAILNPENINHLKKNGFLVLLTAAAETIEQRIKHGNDRPSLTDKDPLDEIRYLLEQRDPVYTKAADLILDTESKTIDELIQILELL